MLHHLASMLCTVECRIFCSCGKKKKVSRVLWLLLRIAWGDIRKCYLYFLTFHFLWSHFHCFHLIAVSEHVDLIWNSVLMLFLEPSVCFSSNSSFRCVLVIRLQKSQSAELQTPRAELEMCPWSTHSIHFKFTLLIELWTIMEIPYQFRSEVPLIQYPIFGSIQ